MAYANPEMLKKPEKAIEELVREGLDLSKLVPKKTTLETTQLSRTAVTEGVVSNIILSNVIPDAEKILGMYKIS